MAKRRNKGAGTVFKKQSGNYAYQYTMPNGKKKTQSLKTKNKAEAIEKAAKLEKELGLTSLETIPIEDVLQLFLTSPKRVTHGDEIGHTQRWDKFTEWLGINYPGIKELNQITKLVASAYGRKLENDNLAEASHNKHTKTLRAICDILSIDAGMPYNPFKEVAIKVEHKYTKKDFSIDQINDIHKALETSKIKDADEFTVLAYLGRYTGMRRGDCCLIKKDNIDYKKEIISVTPSKTKHSSAKSINIPLHPTLANVLQKCVCDENGYFLPKLAKRYSIASQRPGISNSWTLILKEAGIQASRKINGRLRPVVEYGFHSYRHAFVSFCANAGVPLAIVQDIVGHNNPQITKIYTHISDEARKQVLAALPDHKNTENPVAELRRQIAGIATQDINEFKKAVSELIK